MSATTTVVVPLAIKAMTNEQLLAVFNRWGTKPCKKFEKRSCGEHRVARLLDDLEMSVEEACAPPNGYAGEDWDVAFPAPEEAPSEPEVVEVDEPELLVAEAPAAPVEKTARKRGELGKTAQAIFDLASRKTGASAKELMAATGWKAGPSWPNQFNRLSLRTGTRFHQQKVNGEMRYYLS
jgi:hypothetical protein